MDEKISLLLLWAVTTYSYGDGDHHESPLSNPIQNTREALGYFDNELNFTTGPVNVKASIGSGAVIVDVRAEADFNAGHIPGAINLLYDKWDHFKGQQAEFPGLSKKVFNYIYCYDLLCNLGQLAARKFASLGYPVKEMKGGFKSWVDHAYQVEM